MARRLPALVVLTLGGAAAFTSPATFARGLGRGWRGAATAATEAPVEEAPCGIVESTDAAVEPCAMAPPFNTVLAANRAEIAVRIMRAAAELNMRTVAVYGYEDRNSAHRWGADQSFLLPAASTPVGAYLDPQAIIDIAVANGVDAIHPGYGFLSESAELARKCEQNGITFVGPTVENLEAFADKTKARAMAIASGVPVVPGTDDAVTTPEEAEAFVEEFGLPVIIKASMGGGGKGMRVVRKLEDVGPAFASASSEAKAAFGDGSCFLERYVDRPQHIEVQIVGDGKGNVVHLYERDCSVQRRHQKVVEIAPAWNLDPDLRAALHADAVKLTADAKYKNAGTVEFLVDEAANGGKGAHYFIEVNPRIQVEHTVTEEVTSVDLVQTQMLVAGGASLDSLGLAPQEKVRARGVAIQCRVTTEDPERDFAPDAGTLSVFRNALGAGVRVDGTGYSGMVVTPFYDSLLVKYTARAADWPLAVRRMRRALMEMRIRGVKSNVPFLLNVLDHPSFVAGKVTTSFIDENPGLVAVSNSSWNVVGYQQQQKDVMAFEKSLRYIAQLAVNGHPPELGADAGVLARQRTLTPVAPPDVAAIRAAHEAAGTADMAPRWRQILLDEGPDALAKAVRAHKPLLVSDTTWRDAHQSLLATRVRTAEFVNAAEGTRAALGAHAFSLEMWGGATFDVAMRFLRECPWRRLERLRALVPDVPFQMLLRGANAVGYTNYPDNVVREFCARAKNAGIDIFRVFDALNYAENMRLGIEAARDAGGFVEATICYTGDVTNADPDYKYNLEYYLSFAREIIGMGAHAFAIKDMAGLLTPAGATKLVSALRAEFPDVPIHVHTHDTAGAGVAAMLAAADAGADVVDGAIDAMSGLTSQPSLGAIVANARGSSYATGLPLGALAPLNAYWEDVRASYYAPFESGQLAGSSDVYMHEMPGGQYTNLLFQSKQLGLSGRWGAIKAAYADANQVLGDIPKVTPSSKVVGDLAQFMVSRNIGADDVRRDGGSLDLPGSVVEYFQGCIGVPPGGFPEELRKSVLARAPALEGAEGGKNAHDGRPGAALKDYDFEEATAALHEIYGAPSIGPHDVLSYALYPKVYTAWHDYERVYGQVEKLPTYVFLNPLAPGDEVEFEIDLGRRCYLKVASIGELDASGSRLVTFEVNGERRFLRVTDDAAVAGADGSPRREKVSGPSDKSAVGAPMPGVVVDVKALPGDEVEVGQPLFVLSAMKMETTINAPSKGVVGRVTVNSGDSVEADDLLATIDP